MHDTTEIEKRYAPPTYAAEKNSVDVRITVEGTDDENLRNELAMLLASEDGVLARPEPLKSEGRASFGRSNEGREGVALFVPHDG